MNGNKKYRINFAITRLLSAVTSVLFFLAIAVLYRCADIAEDKFRLELDLTENHFFELSSQSAEFIRTVSKNVNIVVMMDEHTLETGGGYFTQAKYILDQYSYYNDNISVEYVDLVKNPVYASQYPQYTLDYYDILVLCGDKSFHTTLTDLFNIRSDAASGKRYIVSSKADQVITSAILRLTSDYVPKISLLTGHNERYTDEMVELLQDNGYEVEWKNLLTEEIDSEADLIISIAPTKDYEPDVLEKLVRFMSNGKEYGKHFLFAPDTEASLPNLETYLSQWGIDVENSFIIETNPRYILDNISYMCLVDITDMGHTDKLSTQQQILSPLGRKLDCSFEKRSGYITEVLLEYSEDSQAVPLDATEMEASSLKEKGTHPALIRSSFLQYDGNDEKKSSVIIFAAPGYFEGSILQSSSVANAEYFVALLNEEMGKEETLIAAPKELNSKELGINQFQLYGMGIIFAVIVPLAVILFGIFVWIYRRHR